VVSLLGVVTAFVGDALSGSEASFSFFYLIAIALGAWFVGTGWGLALSLLSAAGWTEAYFLGGARYSRPALLYWNIGIELLVFAGVTLALGRVQVATGRARALQLELEGAYGRLDRDMRSVGDLQRSLLPPELPEVPGLTLAIHYAPSARAGGDYYDFFVLPNGRLGLWIADAAGHGAAAAVIMAMTRVLLHAAERLPDAPGAVLAMLNRPLARTMPSARFVTACYAVLDPRTGALDYALAGHPPPLLVRHAGGTEVLNGEAGPPLGIFPVTWFPSRAATLAPDDALVLHTDGLTEAASPTGEFFGAERLVALVDELGAGAPATIRAGILAALEAHLGGRSAEDDVTLVALRLGAPPGTAAD
jgi:phosphoserine phosphatase RsbU/P